MTNFQPAILIKANVTNSLGLERGMGFKNTVSILNITAVQELLSPVVTSATHNYSNKYRLYITQFSSATPKSRHVETAGTF